MTPVFLAAVDGSDGARRSAAFAAERARREGARLVLLHVVDWSPYDILTTRQIAERKAEREKEIEAAERDVLEPTAAAARGEGLEVETLVRHGHPAETICEVAGELGATQVFAGRRGVSKIGSLLFGSVSGSLVQACPVPLTIVP